MNKNNYSKILCEKIIDLRKKSGFTQEALAEKLGITFQAVSKWENGLSCPDIALLPVIAEIFQVSIDELFGGPVLAKPQYELINNLPWNDDKMLHVVIYKGKKILDNLTELSNDFKFTYIGEALNVESHCSIFCEIIQNGAKAGVNIECDTINGNVNVAGDVVCDTISGNVTAGCDIKCDTIKGVTNAGCDINCDTIKGDVTCAGDITCDTINGDVLCNGVLTCENNND